MRLLSRLGFPPHFLAPPHAVGQRQGLRCTSDLVHTVDYWPHSGHTSAGCSSSRGCVECTARIEGVSHLPKCLGITPARLFYSYLFLCPSAGTTLLCVSCVCLWPKAVLHGYILVVMCMKKDESMKCENHLQKDLEEHAARILGQGCVFASQISNAWVA